ncbi:hypothetical protein WJX72_009964 [[Myrmecia] bisecta]|uniref:Serine/threonine-protein kinase 19 n=1 Tax=[Myrmecia] bisecta TaxID=41462 RepID=A0AAW1R944_9CHLO
MSREPRAKRQKIVRLYPDEDQPAQQVTASPAYVSPSHLQGEPMASPPEETGNLPADLDDWDAADVPNDTMVALQLLRAQFPAKATVEPVMLRSQLYTLVKDRTSVDRQLDELRQSGAVRMFKLPATVDEYAFMFAADYMAMVGRARQELQDRSSSEGMLAVLEWFVQRVLPRCTTINISHGDLLRLLTSDKRGRRLHDTVTGDHVGLLLNCGLLTKHVKEADTFWFAVPQIGRVVTSLVRGRKEILGMLSRKRYPEVFVKDLEKRKLQYSILDPRFHIRDLVGSGALAQMETTSGLLLRLNKKT